MRNCKEIFRFEKIKHSKRKIPDKLVSDIVSVSFSHVFRTKAKNATKSAYFNAGKMLFA